MTQLTIMDLFKFVRKDRSLFSNIKGQAYELMIFIHQTGAIFWEGLFGQFSLEPGYSQNAQNIAFVQSQ